MRLTPTPTPNPAPSQAHRVRLKQLLAVRRAAADPALLRRLRATADEPHAVPGLGALTLTLTLTLALTLTLTLTRRAAPRCDGQRVTTLSLSLTQSLTLRSLDPDLDQPSP